MNPSGFKSIAFRRDGRVLHAMLNRPEEMNAIDDAMHEEIERLFVQVLEDETSSVLVLTGAGRAFSAGGNIEAMQEGIDRPDVFLRQLDGARRLIFSILDCPKPVIAKVNGPAIGLGATIALFCDIVIAARHAKIADPHVRVGLPAGDGGAVIWPALLGHARAKGFLLTGEAITGEEAARIGLIHSAPSAEDLDAAVDELAQRLASGAPRAIQWTKLAVNTGLKQLVHSILDTSLAYEALANRTQDHQEAVNAFREKRPPRFSGG